MGHWIRQAGLLDDPGQAARLPLPRHQLDASGRLTRTGGVDEILGAVGDGALPVGEEHGLPLVRFPLDRTADAHRAVEGGAVGKVLVDVTS